MTICFSIRKPAFIVTGTDVLAQNKITHISEVQKKFLVNTKRNVVVLVSGSWLLQKPKPDPRELLINGMNEIISKYDTMINISKKLLELINSSYEKTDKVELQLQLCGFDGKIPHIFSLSRNFEIIQDYQLYLTGAPAILDYIKTEEGKSQVAVLNQMIPNVQIVQESVRKLLTKAIDYENKKAIANGEKIKTGGGINIVTVFPNRIFWSDPKADSKDDLYQLKIR